MRFHRSFLFPLLLFIVYEVLATLASLVWAEGSAMWLSIFVLTALGLTVLTVYRLVNRGAWQPVAAGAGDSTAAAQVTTAAPPVAEETSGPLSALVSEASRRLAQAPALANRRARITLTDLPLYLIAGAAGAGKTTAFLSAELSPELLAGQVFRESTVLPTSLCNLWYAQGAIFAEAGGRFFQDNTSTWRGFVRQLHGRGADSLIARLTPVPRTPAASLRGVIWCCDIQPFLGIPDPSRISALARKVQERLLQVGEEFGADFPVYVVFTKADQVPHFSEFVHRLSGDEDRQVLGCTLPLGNGLTAGEVYADGQTRRLLDPFNQLLAALADKRLTLLAREPEAARKPGVYEFPRELKRVRDSVVHFLVEAMRPNPLQPGPVLRGFYFTGMREVPEGRLGQTMPGAGEPPPPGGEATVLFDASSTQEIAKPAEPAGRSRRWAFSSNLFHKVILTDPFGRAAGARSVHQDRRARALLAVASICGVMMTIGFTTSWWGNRALLAEIERAASAPFSRPAPGALPSQADLSSLDGLRQPLEALRSHDRDGVPWRLRWGLYAGDRVRQNLLDSYFAYFRQYFLADSLNAMSGGLARLGPQAGPAVSYVAAYDTLKAYRMVTSSKCAPEPAFLNPVFTRSWLGDRQIEPDQLRLASAQIAYYGSELARGNPYKLDEKSDLVERGRLYLSSFGGIERLYRAILEDANRQPRQPARIADLAPNFRQVLTGPGEVQAAFTREGWTFVEAAIRDPRRRALGEPCVVGGAAAVTQLSGGAKAAAELTSLYLQDYAKTWKQFLRSTAVTPFRGAGEAYRNLEILADNRSPLLAAVYLVAAAADLPAPVAAASAPAMPPAAGRFVDRLIPASVRNAGTALATAAIPSAQSGYTAADVVRVFQPAREVVAPGNRERLVADSNRAYMAALGDLQRAMARLEADRPSNPDLALHDQARRAAEAGLDSVRQLSQKFNIDGSEGMDLELKRILESPFRHSLRLIITDPAKAGRDKAAGAVRALRARLASLERKFPFDPRSEVDASADEVAAIFAPPAGALYAMHEQLGKAVVRQGRFWVRNPEAPEPRLTPEFLQFLNRMTAIAEALFADGATQPRMRYGLRPVPGAGIESIVLELDGDRIAVQSGQQQAKLFAWPGAAGAQQVLLRVRAGASIPFASYEGMWGIFRLIADADPRSPGSRTIELSKVRRGRGRPESVLDENDKPIQVRLEITQLPGGLDVFDKGFFNIRCPAEVAE